MNAILELAKQNARGFEKVELRKLTVEEQMLDMQVEELRDCFFEVINHTLFDFQELKHLIVNRHDSDVGILLTEVLRAQMEKDVEEYRSKCRDTL